MEDKSYEIDKMLNTLVDLAREEVEKAKQRGYFGKDVVEPATMVIALANEKYGTGGYGNHRNDYPGYGNYGYGAEGEFGTGNIRGRQGERYGRNGERYG